MLRGRFVFYPGTARQIVIPNLITDEGEQAFLRMIARADVSDVSSGGNFYMGLCSDIPADTDSLSDITTEPDSSGGYARQAIARNSTGWPNEGESSGARYIQSLVVSFAASGDDFSATFQRAFLCNVASGASGLLFAYSGLLPNAIQVLDGETHQARYELYMR